MRNSNRRVHLFMMKIIWVNLTIVSIKFYWPAIDVTSYVYKDKLCIEHYHFLLITLFLAATYIEIIVYVIVYLVCNACLVPSGAYYICLVKESN